LDRDFIEIHTPKTLGGTSEGGSEVFKFDYFGKEGCLAQSPQLYKQMMIMADFEGVFEIGPVFRAENSHTHRHLCEFTGLDMEMQIKEHYFEILEVIGNLFNYIFKGLAENNQKLLSVINEQFEFVPFQFSEKPVILTFAEGVALLKEAGVEQSVNEDLNTATERTLGKIVLEKFKTDFYILHRYPESARPFYTMLCQDDPSFTCSYDVFMRGQEIISGAQRIHVPEVLAERAEAKGIPPSTIQDYIDSFKFGAYPHGGFGAGMERIVMLYLDLLDVRQTSAFPRDPVRLAP
jgi:aspartyl-tRNA synthetase